MISHSIKTGFVTLTKNLWIFYLIRVFVFGLEKPFSFMIGKNQDLVYML